MEYFDSEIGSNSDGAWKTFLRMRKWLMLCAVSLFLINTRIWDIEAVATALHMSALKRETVQSVLSVAAVYQAIMLLVILWQLRYAYGSSIVDRLGSPIIAHTKQGQNELMELRQKVDALKLDPALDDDAAARHNEVMREFQAATHNVAGIQRRLKEERNRRLVLVYPEVAKDLLKGLPVVAIFVTALMFHSRFDGLTSISTPAPPQQTGLEGTRTP